MAKWSPIWSMEEKYESVRRWMTRVGGKSGSEGTRKSYLYQLNKFCEHIGKNPDELIQERKEHLESRDEFVRKKHEEMLMRFFQDVDGRSSRSNAVSHFKGIKSFYAANYLDLKIDTPKNWTAFTDKVPSLEDLKKMVDVARNPLEKAVILFCAQSGQRVGVVTAMTYGMLKEGLESAENPVGIPVNGELKNRKGKPVNKNRQNYVFFIGADAISAVKTYIDHMRVEGYSFRDDSPLFVTERKYYDKVAGQGETLKGGAKSFRALDRQAVNRIIRRCAIKAGLMDKNGIKTPGGSTRYPVHAHCMRKFWQTAMEQAGIAKPWYEYVMGHSLGELDKAYSRPTVTRLREAYVKAQPYLSVSRLNIMPDMDQIRKEMMLALFKQQAQMMNFDPERIAITKAQERGEELTIDEEIELLQETILNKTLSERVENNCHEHKVVDLSELTGYLNKGWELLHEVSGGKQFVLKYPIPGTAMA